MVRIKTREVSASNRDADEDVKKGIEMRQEQMDLDAFTVQHHIWRCVVVRRKEGGGKERSKGSREKAGKWVMGMATVYF